MTFAFVGDVDHPISRKAYHHSLMSLLTRLFSRGAKVIREDDTFGRMEYEGGLWMHIPASDSKSPMIIISALADGPSTKQRAFYSHLQPRLDTLCTTARSFLQSEGTIDFDPSQLSLYSIEIPEDDGISTDSFGLELADEDANMIYGVTFEQGLPKITYAND